MKLKKWVLTFGLYKDIIINNVIIGFGYIMLELNGLINASISLLADSEIRINSQEDIKNIDGGYNYFHKQLNNRLNSMSKIEIRDGIDFVLDEIFVAEMTNILNSYISYDFYIRPKIDLDYYFEKRLSAIQKIYDTLFHQYAYCDNINLNGLSVEEIVTEVARQKIETGDSSMFLKLPQQKLYDTMQDSAKEIFTKHSDDYQEFLDSLPQKHGKYINRTIQWDAGLSACDTILRDAKAKGVPESVLKKMDSLLALKKKSIATNKAINQIMIDFCREDNQTNVLKFIDSTTLTLDETEMLSE